MQYQVELYDLFGRRVAVYDEVPLLEAVRSGPDGCDEVAGLLPKEVSGLAPGYRVRVLLDGRLFCDCTVEETAPEWSDLRKLVLDRYVSFHEVAGFVARSPWRNGNVRVSAAYANREIGAMVRDLLQRARGPVHCWVAHGAYPDGARREHEKFLARQTEDNALEIGGIAQGQWVGGTRIDAALAYAKDGDTIVGLRVDGVAWPDLRLMMLDCEEMSRNTHAVKRHPEVAFWTDAEYAASAYRRKAEQARLCLQALLDRGIDYIELNPHRNASGAFDDRVDTYGRHVGLVYGGGECFSAALVEQGLADVYLYEEGRYHVPEHALKDFFSYTGPHTDSVESTGVALGSFDVSQGLLEALTALAYAAGGFVFSVDAALGVSFRRMERADRVMFFDAEKTGLELGVGSANIRNRIGFQGNPFVGNVRQTVARADSVAAHGACEAELDFFAINNEADATRLLEGLLDDLAYPEARGRLTLYRGAADIAVGEVIEFRGAPLRALHAPLAEAWGGRFPNGLTARVCEVRHRLSGKRVVTQASLSSPLRSVESPLGFMVRGQEPAGSLFEFRLDDEKTGLDLGYHLD